MGHLPPSANYFAVQNAKQSTRQLYRVICRLRRNRGSVFDVIMNRRVLHMGINALCDIISETLLTRRDKHRKRIQMKEILKEGKLLDDVTSWGIIPHNFLIISEYTKDIMNSY